MAQQWWEAAPVVKSADAARKVPASDARGAVEFAAPADAVSPAEAARLGLAFKADARAAAAQEGRVAPAGYRFTADGSTLEPVPGGPADPNSKVRPLREGDAQKLVDDVTQVDALKRSLNSFQDDFAGNLAGDVENIIQGVTGNGTPGQRDWWADFRASDNVIRNALFGASLTAGEKSAYQATTITPRMSAEEVKRNLARRLQIVEAATNRRVNRLRAGGYNEGEIDAIAGPVLEQPVEAPQDNGRIVKAPPGTASGVVMGAMQEGEPILTEKDMADRAALQQAWDSSGGSPEAVKQAATAVGRMITPELDAFMRDNAGQRVQLQVTPTGTPTATQEAVGEFVATPTGERVAAAAVGGANASAFGLLDELAPVLGLDAGRVEMAKRYLQERQPVASLAGEISGSVIPGAALARGVNIGLAGTRLAGIAPLAGDAIAGGLAGAGEANENRLGGAALGATVGTAAGAAGRRVFGAGADGMGGDGLPPSGPQGGAGGPMGGMGGRASGGAAATPEDVVRVTRSQELPVPIQLANFQKSRAFEQQQRARELAKNNEVGGPIRELFAEQQRAMAANFDAFLEKTGSEIWQQAEEQGLRVTAGIKKMADQSKAKYRALYKRAETSGETREPVAYDELRAYIADQTPTTREQLAPVLRAVNEQLSKNDAAGTGQMTLQQLEDVRKLINKTVEPGTPNAVYGGEMKAIIDGITENAGGDIYKSARAARREHAVLFDEVGTIAQLLGTKRNSSDRVVAAEQVVDKLISSATPAASLRKLRDLVTGEGGDPQAWREVQGAAIERIRNAAYPASAQVDETGARAVSVAGLRRMVDRLDQQGKLDVIFDYETAKGLRTIADVAQDVFTGPPGTGNPAGTSSALINALDMIINFGVAGVPIPGGVVNNVLKPIAGRVRNRDMRKEVKQLIGEPAQ